MTRKTKAAPKTSQTPPPANVLPPIKIGRLDTVTGWRKEVARVYREMRRGEMPTEIGTKLSFVANVGAQLAKYEQELAQLQQLREQLAQIQGKGGSLLTHSTEVQALLSAPAYNGEQS